MEKELKLLLFLMMWIYFIYSEATKTQIFQNMKADLHSLLLTENHICRNMLRSNRKPQLFILKSLISNVQVFLTTVVLSGATKIHNYNDFSVRVLRVVSLVEEKGDINYHQVKITTINAFITSEGSNLCE